MTPLPKAVAEAKAMTGPVVEAKVGDQEEDEEQEPAKEQALGLAPSSKDIATGVANGATRSRIVGAICRPRRKSAKLETNSNQQFRHHHRHWP